MGKTAILSRAADLAHKGFVVGLVSVFGYQLYQIGSKTMAGQVAHKTMDSTYFEDVEKKVKEEYR